MEPTNQNEPWFSPHQPLSNEEARRNAAERARENRKGQLQRLGIPRFVFVCGLIVVGFIAYDFVSRKPFDSSTWKKSNTYEQLSIRAALSDDLFYSQKLIGLNRSQMLTLLGKPDQEPVGD